MNPETLVSTTPLKPMLPVTRFLPHMHDRNDLYGFGVNSINYSIGKMRQLAFANVDFYLPVDERAMCHSCSRFFQIIQKALA